MRTRSELQSPIEDYALIGDCRAAALVSRAGSIDWLCLPDFSSPSLFAALLDPDRGGRFALTPRRQLSCERRYLDGTAVLETEIATQTGVVRITDLFPLIEGDHALAPMREILRVVDGIEGEITLDVHLDIRPHYGRTRVAFREVPRLGWRCGWGNELVLLRTEARLEPSQTGLAGSVRVRAGGQLCFSLAYVQQDVGVIVPLGAAAERRLQHTVQWWQGWSSACTYDGPYREHVLRSALTLKLLIFAPSGAIVAAPTTSLPEVPGGSANWDYRFCWLRDAGLTTRVLVALGFREEARCFLSWLLHATRLTWPRLQILYDVYGRTRLTERTLDHFQGYRGAQPVRIGNAAIDQLQLDVYGQVILAADALVQAGEKLDAGEARLLRGLGDTVVKLWREPDAGIWEKRGPPQHHTFSKVMCWLALDRLLKLDESGAVPLGRRGARFTAERDAIFAMIEERGFNASIGAYTSTLDGDRLDASLLLMACLGYKEASDPRMVSTFERIQERLGHNGLLYRYERDDEAARGREGAFGICSFWAIDNLVRRGAIAEAERMFEHVLGFANDLGLFAEEIDPESGAALGNFPQGFTHIGLVTAATAIAEARTTLARAA